MIHGFKDNAQLIGHLKSGDEKAYSFLVDTYNHRLCLYANSLINNGAIAQDIVQNVFLKVWEKRNGLKTYYPLQSFLYKSVYNGCINEYKRNMTVTALEKKYMEALDRIIEDTDEDNLEKLINLVKMAIEDLPPKCKEIFILSKREGLTNIEIAEYLNISKNTIERQINIAFSKIRKTVGEKTNVLLFLLFGPRSCARLS